MRRLLLTFALMLLAATLAADPPLPEPTGFVTDQARLLSTNAIDELDARARAYQEQTGNEIAILIVRSIGDRSIEDYAYDVFKKWGVGTKQNDNGVLFVVALDQRKARIEVGYGLEGALTDLECGRLVNKSSPMADDFRAGDYEGGVKAVFDGIVAGISGDYVPPQPKKRSKKSKTKNGPLAHVIMVAALAGLVLLSRLKRRNNYWRPGGPRGTGGIFGGGGFTLGGGSGFGGGGGGFGGFSGGSSGGGGASGGW